RDALRTGFDDLRDVPRVDSAERKPGNPRALRRITDELETDGRAAFLRRRRKDGTHSDVIGVSLVELLGRMRREARSEAEPPGRLDGEVVLADVDEIRFDEQR